MEDSSNPMNENDGLREIFLSSSSGGFFRSVVTTGATSSTNRGRGRGESSSLNGPTHEAFLEHHRQEVEEANNNKAKIMAHPRYYNLLQAFLDCQVGAPPEAMERLAALRQPSPVTSKESSNDPELDQFMEAYCNMLMKYKEELTTTFQEVMDFTRTIETRLQMLADGAIGEKCEGGDSSEEGQESGGGGEAGHAEFDPRGEDGELKKQLMKKYSGCLSSLKQEFSKKRKKGKLPKEARQKLLNWWELHSKWPYPSETEKVALVESTGLDEKQINNWFVNQRKRHWKPTGDVHFMVMDAGLYRFQRHRE